jgi:hypothetical protein
MGAEPIPQYHRHYFISLAIPARQRATLGFRLGCLSMEQASNPWVTGQRAVIHGQAIVRFGAWVESGGRVPLVIYSASVSPSMCCVASPL